MNENKKYYIAQAETKLIIDETETLQEAEEFLETVNKEDEESGEFEYGYWAIMDSEENIITG